MGFLGHEKPSGRGVASEIRPPAPGAGMPLWGWLVLAGAWLALWAGVPIPVPYNMDFLMLYAAVVGLGQGVGLYDHAGQAAVMAARLGKVVRLPFYVYPPWYALSAAWLGALPLPMAARVWFGLSLGLVVLGLGLWLRPRGWREALGVALAALAWLPTWGLAVGQYVAPVWLGLALALWGWRRRRALPLAVGAALLTFKPHLGVVALAWLAAALWARWEARWARRALAALAGTLALLPGVAFAVQPDWPWAYRAALAAFGAQDTFEVCDPCAGPGALLLRGLTGAASMRLLVPLSLGALLLLLGWAVARRGWHWPPEHALSLAALVPLWGNPYVNNYDFLLLLAPMAWLWSQGRRRMALALGLAPWLGLLGGRWGVNLALNLSLLGCTLALVWAVESASRRRA